MDFITSYTVSKKLLMEGALSERLKREFHLKIDEQIALANLLYSEPGRIALTSLWKEYIEIARTYNLPFLATTPTRRANKERVNKAGYSSAIIKDNVDLLKRIREESEHKSMYIGGLMGCKGDAYSASDALSEREAKEFHSWQAQIFQKADVDFLYAGIMPALSEAVGMAQAMEETGVPYIISFMIRKNGKLMDGTTISDAIRIIDEKVDRKPVCYMTNCVHPKVLYEALDHDYNKTPEVYSRFRGIQANTSPLSPEELDNSIDLKTSDAVLLAKEVSDLDSLIDLKIYGGCCGTDKSHMEEIARTISSEI